jgi:hypothetical protein
VVGLDEKLGGIGKRLVVGEPRRAGVPVRAEDGQVADCGKEPPGDSTGVRVSGKKPVFMKQSQSANSLSAGWTSGFSDFETPFIDRPPQV